MSFQSHWKVHWMDNLVGEPTSSAKGMRLGSGTLVTRPGKRTVCELENHRSFSMGKSPSLMGKSQSLMEKSTISMVQLFNSYVSHYFNR